MLNRQTKICNAKTKQGTLCQNEGHKKNGRCHLHGGNSTGAKTALGKIKSSQNARKKIPNWLMGSISKKDIKLINEALSSSTMLVEIAKHKRDISTDALYQFVENHRVALEVMKYVILERLGNEAFIITQSALDFYYQDKQHSHLECHLFYHHHCSPYFPRLLTAKQIEYTDGLVDKSVEQAMARMDAKA